ncbi:LamB/YcsF family protein [Vibrio nigripulchritudo ATCC 27043]|uniref:5-oxoprolinase subunit PxpA n=1 Tax=Vibrio nigripulchritudo TaxID=28173 RepID=UPI00021C37D9|nr:5-oxoprolinase subunit PxpA [Vibrio nigripulchritudo]EGU60183.1 LamB/YcsF family protein [Vibrio nigripulchritudo ATCC 27043]
MTKERLKLNCDMGESFGSWKMGLDEEVMPWVDMANIACGFHASDPNVMSTTLKLAKQYRVSVGAHPGYPDLNGFGRRSIPMSQDEIVHNVVYQVGAIQSLANLNSVKVEYIKPHGALYNDMMKSEEVFVGILAAAENFSLPVMILAGTDNSRYLDLADQFNVPLLFEAFADRAYLDNGLLVPRSHPDAVYHKEDDIYHQVMQLARYGSITSINSSKIQIEADTVCVHGDNPESVAMVQRISQSLAAL